MKRTLTTTMLVAVAALGLALGGCKKENKNGGAGGAAGGGGGGAAAAVPAKTGFAVFPSDSSILVGFNLNQARSSAMWKKYKDQIEAVMAKQMSDVKTACGWDPLTSIQSVIGAGNPDSDKAVLVVKGLDRGKLKECAPKLAAKNNKQVTITDDGNLSKWTSDGKDTWVAWLDNSTVVVAPDQDKAYVQARAAGKDGLGDSSELMQLLKSTDTSATLYIVAGSALIEKNAGSKLPGAKGFFASLKIDSGLSLDAGLRFDTADNAKKITDMMKQQLSAVGGQLPPPFGQIVSKATIKNVDKDMVVQLKLNESELQQLSQAIKQFAPMLMSGMGGGHAP